MDTYGTFTKRQNKNHVALQFTDIAENIGNAQVPPPPTLHLMNHWLTKHKGTRFGQLAWAR